MTTDDERLWYSIQDIVRKHTKQNWITPYQAINSIPNDEIYALKQDLFNLCKSLQKGTDKDKM